MSFAAVVLAAGAGSRFGGAKLAASFRGRPLIAHAIAAARAAPVAEVVVVCTPELDIGEWEESGPPVSCVRIATTDLSDSLKAGIAVLDNPAGVFVFLGDMPLVPHEVAGQLLAVLAGNFAALPFCQGKPGHPVLLSARALAPVARLTGDQGAGVLLRGRADVAVLEHGDEGVVADIDRAEDLARLERSGPLR